MRDKFLQIVAARDGFTVLAAAAHIVRVTLNGGQWRGVWSGRAVVRLSGNVWQVLEV